MTHDFGAAQRWLHEAFRIEDMPKEHPIHSTLVALRFTKAALSGEVSRAMYAAAYEYICAGQDRAAFKAMCAELAKEVGNEND